MAHVSNPALPAAADSLEILRRRLLVDGFNVVMDLEASRGCYLRDALTGQSFLDFYSFFASQPVSYHHPGLDDPTFRQRLLSAALTKVANSDVYTALYAAFVRTFDEVAGLPGFVHYFFIDGGALAIENALKAAFDWKVRKNLAAGRGERGHQVIHFRRAFHGRTGYTLSLTDTADPRKTMYFPKFDWPRVTCPAIDFALPEAERTRTVAALEARALDEIGRVVAERGPDLAALIIEPIQGEGGDNHFRPEFLQALRRVCDEHDLLLIFDEVQTGLGLTGSMWCTQQMGVLPDILAFGKKAQICGIMATARVDEVDSVFKVPSRINSTWGGNLADMVRATRYLEIIRDDHLVENAAAMGRCLLDGLHELARRHPQVSAVRGRGLMCAFDLATPEQRDALRRACYERQMLVLACGERSIRFRPMLDVQREHIDTGLKILDAALASL